MAEQEGSGPRTALVTGGGRGLGLAIARRLLRDGYAVLIVDVNLRNAEALDGVAAEHPGRFLRTDASVTDRVAITSAVQELVERFGRLDALVNNAGINRPGNLFTHTDDEWDAVLATNLKGAFVCSAVAAPAMQRGGSGAIVNIGSIAGAGMGAGSPAYAAAKAGLVGLTKNLANLLGPDGIRVNLVAPGLIETEWTLRNLPQASWERAASGSPLRQVGKPEHVAATVAFLCSPDAGHITGQVISVSGGEWMP